jgi:hypothetical protein
VKGNRYFSEVPDHVLALEVGERDASPRGVLEREVASLSTFGDLGHRALFFSCRGAAGLARGLRPTEQNGQRA